VPLAHSIAVSVQSRVGRPGRPAGAAGREAVIGPPFGPAELATRTWTAYGVRVVDLIDAELLPAGTQLLSTVSTVDALATVLPDGKIAYDDEVYDSPSAAAVAARNGSANGWTFWAADTPDGRFTLAALRDLYMGQSST